MTVLNTNIAARPIYGWVCSKCDKSYAPSVTECSACNHTRGASTTWGPSAAAAATGGIISLSAEEERRLFEYGAGRSGAGRI